MKYFNITKTIISFNISLILRTQSIFDEFYVKFNLSF